MIRILNTVDYIVIAIYMFLLIFLGFYLKKKASKSLEDYCIGGRNIPWWAMGISGMASWLDVAGTMIIVSFLFLLGPRGLYIEFRGGACLLLPFMLLWCGKWLRRSKVITPAEWMIFRFGDNFSGRFAQLAAAITVVFTTIGMLSYLVKAIGLFLSMFIPLSPPVCALILVGCATVYTMVSGFYGVIFTDIFQSAIVIGAVIAIGFLGAAKVAAHPEFANLAYEVTGQQNWMSSVPHFQTHMPKGYEIYESLFMFALFYLIKSTFQGMAFPGDPKYFGARNDRECGTLTLLWSALITVRWPLMLGFTILGIFLVKDLFPDQEILSQTAMVIKQHFPEVTAAQWENVISEIKNNPSSQPKVLMSAIKSLLGDDWARRLLLISYHGTVNPERILPAVVLFSIKEGFRGLILIALIAASMSTFDSQANLSAGVITRDIYQKYIRPKASSKELIYVAWASVFLLVFFGYLFAFTLESINDIWVFINMALIAGAVVPAFLKFYWWRFSGGGFAVATIAGMIFAVAQRFVFPLLAEKWTVFETIQDERWLFSILIIFGFIASIAGSLLTKPTDGEVLKNFYRKTKPFGLWDPVKKTLPAEIREKMQKEHKYDLLALPFALIWQVSIFLLPMQLMLQTWDAFFVTLVIFMAGSTGLYFFWYKKLPSQNWYPLDE